ncbi:hypothetical protein GCM10027427_29140 [Pseudoclavibacter terrae]
MTLGRGQAGLATALCAASLMGTNSNQALSGGLQRNFGASMEETLMRARKA